MNNNGAQDSRAKNAKNAQKFLLTETSAFSPFLSLSLATNFAQFITFQSYPQRAKLKRAKLQKD